jgi:hypothetical protein
MMMDEDPSRPVERWLPVAVFLVAALVYALTLSSHHAEAEDALRYVHEVSHGSLEQWLHPNHLIFNLIQRGFYEVWLGVGYTGTAERPMQVLNLLGGALALALLAAILLRLRLAPGLALLAAGFTGGSFAFWHYAMAPDTYILPLALALFSLDRALILLGRERSRDWMLLGLGLALMVLLHQQHALFAIVLTLSLGLALVTRDRPGPERLRSLVRFVLAIGGAVVLIFGCYVLAGVGVFGQRTLPGLVQWILGYAAGGAWSEWSATSPLKALIGAGRAVIGGHALFANEALAAVFGRLFPGKLLLEESFLVASLGGVRLGIYLTLLAIALPATLVLAIRLVSLRARPETVAGVPQRTQRTWVRRTAWAVLGIYALFNTWWEPANPEFWIFPLPFLAILVALRLQALGDPWSRHLAWVLTLIIAVANLIGSIQPMQDRERDYWYAVNRDLIAQLRPGDLVLTNGGYLSDAMVRFYGAAEVMAVRNLPADELAGLVLERAASGAIYASGWVTEPPQALVATGQVRPRPEVMQALESQGRWVPVLGPDAVQGLWRLQR